MGIDPWSDFEMISQYMGVAQLDPASVAEDGGEDVYLLSDDTGIMPLLDLSEMSWTVEMKGFTSYGIDEDDDEWVGDPVYRPAAACQTGNFDGYTGWNGGYNIWRSAPLNPYIPVSKSGNWTGRPAIVSGDPYITLNSTFAWLGGSVVFNVSNWQEEKGVSSLQILDTSFRFGLLYGYWDDPDTLRVWPSAFLKNALTNGGKISSVHLLINGKDVGEVDCSFSSDWDLPYGARAYSVDIDDTIVSFDEQMVRSVSFEVRIDGMQYQGMNSFVGGVGVMLRCPYSSSKGNGPLVSSSARIVSGSDSDTSGLLSGILGFLQNIFDGIVQLPGKIATAIMDGLKSLFIPSEGFLATWKEELFLLLKERLGFIYQCFEFLGNFFNDFILGWGDSEDYVFHFPGIEFPIQGTTYVLVPEQDIPMSNGLVDILRPFAGTVTSIIVVLAFIHSMEDMFIAIISGWSYFSYLNRGREEENDA